MAIAYKLAVPADAAILAPMNKRMIEDSGHRNPMTVPELETRMETWLARGEYQVVYAEEDGDILGYALFKREPDHVHVRQLFIERNKRTRGYGRMLFQWAERNLWAGGRIRMEVLADNRMGLAFWKAMGFQDYALMMEKEPERK
ncbi:MAG TPA: GNAT family N-acetyltransferase [Fibrobacteria bacterium]|nr:GNAT family N-acetyltransferase [Fibrobacteria bacterium]